MLDFLLDPLSSDTSAKCRHETDDIWPAEDERIWHLVDTELADRTYWCENDANFEQLQARIRTFRCKGCGETRQIQDGHPTGEVRWKEGMDREELALWREYVNCGSMYNGWLWWEQHEWDGPALSVATPKDRDFDQL